MFHRTRKLAAPLFTRHFPAMNTPMDIKGWRRAYCNEDEPFLLEKNLPSRNPHKLFAHWFQNVASKADLMFEEVNAVSLSTVDKRGRPRSRMVLLKEYNDEGFVFFTNSDSHKGAELAANPHAAMLFFWPRVHRQVRVEGAVSVLPSQMAVDYWMTRPVSSRIGSAASCQSSAVPSRDALTHKKAELEKKAEQGGEQAITKPESWNGYILRPDYFEFWQGQSDRLHDRIVFDKTGDEPLSQPADDGWFIKRLSP